MTKANSNLLKDKGSQASTLVGLGNAEQESYCNHPEIPNKRLNILSLSCNKKFSAPCKAGLPLTTKPEPGHEEEWDDTNDWDDETL